MTLPTPHLLTIEDVVKERERQRLHRYLFIKFGRKKFNMHWTEFETSFTNYQDIYVKYDLQTEAHRTFSPEELRMLRKAHAIHERGHIEYDVAGVTTKWREDHYSPDKKDWEANHKYPMGWLKFFSGMMIDVRMEYFVTVDLPEAKPFFDFCNEHWRFGIRGAQAGHDRLHDFQECLGSRGFFLPDIPNWHPDAVQLVDSVMDILEDVRLSKSTQECMDNTLRLVKAVWSTLWDWMVEDNKVNEEPHYNESGHDRSNWGDANDVSQNTKRVMAKIEAKQADQNEQKEEGSSEDDAPENPKNQEKGKDVKNLLKHLETEIAEDEKAANEEVGPYQRRFEEVTIRTSWHGKALSSDQVVLMPFPNHNPGNYEKLKEGVKRQIHPVAAALKKLLEPAPDRRYVNQRSGRLNVTKVWAASVMDDPHIFTKVVPGTPAQDARILVLGDCSGSTHFLLDGNQSRIEAIKSSMVLLSEATQSAKIPTAVYAFTESNYEGPEGHWEGGTIIYPLKPFGKLSEMEKGFIGGLVPMDGNRDTVALQWAVNELTRYREGIRLLIVISDGQPCFKEGENQNTMRGIVQQAQREGIDVLCLFIGEQHYFEGVKHMYPGGAIFVSRNLAKDLTQNVLRIIKKRRR